MANKRASIKGRGIDILFGEEVPPKKPALEIEREVDMEELLGEEAGLAEPKLDADLKETFGEEVVAMEPVPPPPVTPAREPPPRAREIISPPLEVPPSSEPRKVSVTLKVEEPSPPPTAPAPRVEEVPPTPTYPPAAPAPRVEEVPPPPTYPPVTPAPRVEAPPSPEIPPRRWEEAAYGPPPSMPEPTPAEAAPTAPPGRPPVSPYDRPPPEIKPGGYLIEHPVALGEEAGLPTGVVPGEERRERVEAERAEEIPPQISPEVSERTVLSRLGEERQSNLLNEIDTLVVEAAQILSVDKGLDEALSLLREARDISIERPRQFDQAEYRVAKVRAMLERKQNISRWSLIYGYPVLLYEVVCFLLLLGSLLFDRSLAVFIANVTGAAPASFSMEYIFPLWNTMAWGGIGGVVGSLYSLYWHAAVEQDFDKQYLMWYIVQPIMGIILGGIVYLIIASGFISIQVLAGQAGTFEQAAQTMANPAVKAFHSVVACVAGFRQRFVYEMLDRVVQVLTPKPKTKAEREAEEAEEAGKKTG